jgi:glycosyltransferase involved in cell wall biosynthesis
MEKIAVAHSDFIITPKEFEADYYRDQFLYEKVFWVPNTSKAQHHISDRRKNETGMSIVYSGSLQSIYKVDDIIQAVARLRDHKLSLTVLGDGPELDNLTRLAHSDARVSFPGWLSGDDYSRILNEADVCYFSTADMAINRYGFSSNKISDYLCRGKPILAHVSFGAEGLVRSGAGLQSYPGDISALEKNIRSLMDDPSLVSAMGTAAKLFYSKHYEYESVVKKLSKLIVN